MFSANSRYAHAGTYTIPTLSGVSLVACRIPIRDRPDVRGFHARVEGQRLDGLAAHYLGDATAFWRLCDASDALIPDALAVADLVPVPADGR